MIAERDHHDECTGDEHDLVVGAERLDRPVLERPRDAVDEDLPDRHDRRRGATDETDDEFGRGQTRTGGDQTEQHAIPQPGRSSGS